MVKKKFIFQVNQKHRFKKFQINFAIFRLLAHKCLSLLIPFYDKQEVQLLNKIFDAFHYYRSNVWIAPHSLLFSVTPKYFLSIHTSRTIFGKEPSYCSCGYKNRESIVTISLWILDGLNQMIYWFLIWLPPVKLCGLHFIDERIEAFLVKRRHQCTQNSENNRRIRTCITSASVAIICTKVKEAKKPEKGYDGTEIEFWQAKNWNLTLWLSELFNRLRLKTLWSPLSSSLCSSLHYVLSLIEEGRTWTIYLIGKKQWPN